jgi:integrase/recombinase XerC
MSTTALDSPPQTLEQALAEYESVHLASRNFTYRTRREYLGDLRSLLAFLTDRCHLSRIDQVSPLQLQAYMAELDARAYSGSTRRRQLSSIKSFFRFLLSHELLATDSSLKLIPPERERPQPRVLTEAEYKHLQLACGHQVRDAAIIEVLLQTGMRLSELANLKVTDVELPVKISKDGLPGSVHILGKGRKSRTLTFNWRACRAVRAYFGIRPKNSDDPHLFLSKLRRRMSPRAIERVIAKYAQEAGLGSVKVHTLRHTFATQHVKNKTSLETVRKALGHESLATTQIYIDLAREVMDKELQEHAL